MAHDVFISYSSKDKNAADAVCATLEARKIRCWIAPRDVPPGKSWPAAIVEAIHASQVFVLVFSNGSNNSTQVIREVGEAVGNSIPILPLRIEDVEPSQEMSYFIKITHWLDAMTLPLEQHLGKLADSVMALLSVDADEQPPPVVETVIEAPVKKRWPLPTWATALLALAVVVIVGGGAWFVATRSGSKTEDSGATSATAVAAVPTETTATSTMESSTSTSSEDSQAKSEFDWRHNPETDHYYALTETGMSWDMLEALAVQTGGHLVSINDAAEEEWLYSTFGSTMFWIGLTDYPDEGEFRWTSGEPVTYLKWCPGEPSDTAGGAGSEDAVHAIPWAQCWNDEPTWITEFWDPEKQENIPSYPGVIEVEALPSAGLGEWRPLSFVIPNPRLWEESDNAQYTAIGQKEVDAFAWSTESFEGDLRVSLELESPESKSSGCVILYGDGQEYSFGSLIFCVDWDGYGLEKHTIYHEGENRLTFTHSSVDLKNKAYSVTIEITDDIASMYVNGEKVFSSFFDTQEIDRSGRVGLLKKWFDPEITFSNIQIKTSGD
jgi:hypothetical protein